MWYAGEIHRFHHRNILIIILWGLLKRCEWWNGTFFLSELLAANAAIAVAADLFRCILVVCVPSSIIWFGAGDVSHRYNFHTMRLSQPDEYNVADWKVLQMQFDFRAIWLGKELELDETVWKKFSKES